MFGFDLVDSLIFVLVYEVVPLLTVAFLQYKQVSSLVFFFVKYNTSKLMLIEMSQQYTNNIVLEKYLFVI